jgi:hypothetical protein
MGQSHSRRYPRLALPALPRVDAGLFWGQHRAILLNALGPVLGILLLLAGGLLALDQYAAYKAEVQRAETGRYLAEFREPPVADAWRRLNAAWQAEWGRQRALLERVATASGSGFDLAVRNYRDFVLDTIAQDRLAGDIETMRAYFARVGACIRIGSCDGAAATAQLGPSVWQFRNQNYYYFKREGLVPDVDRSAFLIAPPGRREPAG